MENLEQTGDRGVSTQPDTGDVALSRDVLVPIVQRIGGQEIETTFLGANSIGQPTWVLWNAEQPYLIGLLREGRLGFTFEQRTSDGVRLHEDVSFNRVQRALTMNGRQG